MIKQYISLLIPNWVKKPIKKRNAEKKLQANIERTKRVHISQEELCEIIDKLPIGDCDVLLHTSLTNIGKIKGGRKFVAKQILEKVDVSKNTLLVAALPYLGLCKQYLDNNPVFDVRCADVATGAINEYLATLPEAQRSIHPTHSVVAIGPQASEYTSKHHLDETPFGPNSPYYKLFKNHGKILLFGSGLSSNTSIHAIEDLIYKEFPIRIYCKRKYIIKCKDWKGNDVIVKTTCHNPWTSLRRNSPFLRRELEERGLLSAHHIGESEILVIDANGFARYYLGQLKQGKSIYGRLKTSSKFIIAVNNAINNL